MKFRKQLNRKRSVVENKGATTDPVKSEHDVARTPLVSPFAHASAYLQPLWTCSVLFYGLFYAGWSAAGVIVCFWFENLTRVSLVAARIYIHREATHLRGHYRRHFDYVNLDKEIEKREFPDKFPNTAIGSGTLFAEYVSSSLISEALSLIALTFFLIAIHTEDSWSQPIGGWEFVKQQWLSKSWIIVLPLIVEFVIDTMVSLRRQSFTSIRVVAAATYESTHWIWLAVLLSMILIEFAREYVHAIPVAPGVLVACVLISLKTLYQISLALSNRDWQAWLNWNLENIRRPSDFRYGEYVEQELARVADDDKPLDKLAE